MKNTNPVMIIAEAAQGYEGNSTLALLLVRAAAAGQADAVKFQLVYAQELATSKYPYYDLFKKLEMPLTAWKEVELEAQNQGIKLVFDVFGQDSLRVALELNASAVKVHATDFFNRELMAASIEMAPHVFFSVGGIEVEEIASVLTQYGDAAQEKLTMMCGFQAEPTETSSNNLARLGEFRKKFPNLRLGFMDHSEGTSEEAGWLGVLALPFNVSSIEKHITLDPSLKLEDYVSALGPVDFRRYVQRIRLAQAALGSGDLSLSEMERGYRRRAIKVVVSKRLIEKGVRISPEDLALLRVPLKEGQQCLERLEDVVGTRILRSIAAEEPILADDLETE